MGDLNSFCCTGRLIRDAETRILDSGRPIRTFVLAINRYRRDGGEETLFLDVAAFGPFFDGIAPYLKKGKYVYVNGYLRQRKWQADDGTQRTAYGLVANSIGFVGSGRENGESSDKASPAAKPQDPLEEDENMWVPF